MAKKQTINVDIDGQLSAEEFKSRSEYGYTSNKDISIQKIDAIEVENFRTLKNRVLSLGKNLTIISGKNGTMKTTLMGLIAHPFTSTSVDCFGNQLKTPLSEVFRLSLKYDDNYSYNILLTSKNNEKIREKITIDERGGRHRIVVSGHEKGDGNFIYNTSFLSLSRLRPIIETKAEEQKSIELNAEEKEELKRFYGSIFLQTDRNDYIAVYDNNKKKTFGPSGDTATYDFNSISSGEDNLGSIFNTLLSFKRTNDTGLICIDEIESSLHPSAQVNLINYLNHWSKQNNIQIVFTTHSLHIIQYIYLNMRKELENHNIMINFISFSRSGSDKNYEIVKNPDYALAYEELTLISPKKVSQQYKTTVYCEDKVAKHMLKTLLGTKICEFIDIQHNLDESENPGTSKNTLINMCRSIPAVLYKTNAFVVLDGDVHDEEVSRIKDKKLFMRLPDTDFYPLEKRIIIYLLQLEANNPLFEKLDKLQETIKNELVQKCRINPPDISTVCCADTKSCKAWAQLDEKIFKKCITAYCKSLDSTIINAFKKDFIERLNASNVKLGLPKIDIN